MRAPEERRTVVVLFAQAAGLAEMPEAARASTADAIFTRFRTSVERFGGTVDKFVDDSVMAVFGAPVAHEDDALRAVRAALELRGEAARLAAEQGISLAIRAGLNSGEVLWGSVGGDRPTAIGDVVNVAQRLRTEAAPGTILAASPVVTATERRIEWKRLGEAHLKGRAQAVEAFEAVGEREGQTEYAAAPQGPLVGRETELNRLAESAASGERIFAVLVGGAGIGKSRLMAELRRRVRAARRGTWIGVGRALEFARTPLGPFADVVRQEAGGARGHETEALVSRIEADLRATVPDAALRTALADVLALSVGLNRPGSPASQIDPARMRSETHNAWAAWLRARAAAGPVLLCLEDLHWADAGTIGLLEALPARLAGAPVSIVAASRPGASLPSGFERIAISELGEADAARLVATVLRRPAAPELARFLYAQSGGHPYYTEELARFLSSRNLVEGDPARLVGAPGKIPEGLQGLLVARLDGLGEDEKSVVKGASVLGRAFWAALLRETLERDVDVALAGAREREIVAPHASSVLPGDIELGFRHALLRDAAYSLLPKKDRARLHTRAGDLLEDRARRLGRGVRRLAAVQREAAGRAEAAAALWLASATEALDAAAAEESLAAAKESERLGGGVPATLATARASLALARLDEAETAAASVIAAAATPEDVARAKLVRASVHEKRGAFAAMLEAAEELAASPAPASFRAEILFVRANARWRLGKQEAARADLAAARAALEEDPDWRTRPGGYRLAAALRNLTGNIHKERGALAEALAEYDAALALAREGKQVGFAARVLSNIGGVVTYTRGIDDALAAYRESAEMLRPTGDRHAYATALTNVGIALRAKGDLVGARQVLVEALALARDVGDQWGIAGCLHNLGNLDRQEGNPERALELLGESLNLRRAAGDRPGAAASHIGISTILLERGRWEEARRSLEEAVAEGRALGNPAIVLLALCNLGCAHYLEGRLDEADRIFRESLETARRYGQQDLATDSIENLGQLEAVRGRAAEAAAHLDEAVRMFRARAAAPGEARCLISLTRLAAQEGRFDEAARLGSETVSFCEKHGLLQELTHALVARSAVRADGRLPGASADAQAAVTRASRGTELRAFALATLAIAEAVEGRAQEAKAALDAARAEMPEDRLSFPVVMALAEAEARVNEASGNREEARRAGLRGKERASRSGASAFVARFESLLQAWK